MSESVSASQVTRRRLLSLSVGLMFVAVLDACQSPQTPAAAPTAVNPLIKPKATTGAELTPVLASSELALGRNRLALSRGPREKRSALSPRGTWNWGSPT